MKKFIDLRTDSHNDRIISCPIYISSYYKNNKNNLKFDIFFKKAYSFDLVIVFTYAYE